MDLRHVEFITDQCNIYKESNHHLDGLRQGFKKGPTCSLTGKSERQQLWQSTHRRFQGADLSFFRITIPQP